MFKSKKLGFVVIGLFLLTILQNQAVVATDFDDSFCWTFAAYDCNQQLPTGFPQDVCGGFTTMADCQGTQHHCFRCDGTPNYIGSLCVTFPNQTCKPALDEEGSKIPLTCGTSWDRVCEWVDAISPEFCSCGRNGGVEGIECVFYECH